MVMATMPIRIAAPTRRATRIAISTSPAAASSTCGSEDLPSPTKVAGLATIILALRSPTKAMNRPMPAAVPCFRQSGISLTMCSRTLVSVSNRKSRPDSNTTPRAVCHGTPRPITIEYVKYALSDIPGASAIG
jgi:hypothetical protein